jgi:hypothetical protein
LDNHLNRCFSHPAVDKATRHQEKRSLIHSLPAFSATLAMPQSAAVSERYYDVETDRAIAVGKHREQLVLIPYEQSENTITPITIHTTTRQQIRFRLKTGRFITNV